MNGSEIVITNLCVGQVGTAQVHLIKKKVVNKFSKSSLGRLRTLLTIRTDYRFLTSTKWSLTGSSFGKINLWSSSWKFSKDPFVLVTSLPPQCTIRLFSGVLFIYAPPMKYWVTIDLKFPLLALTQIVSGEINQKDMIFEALVSKQGWKKLTRRAYIFFFFIYYDNHAPIKSCTICVWLLWHVKT